MVILRLDAESVYLPLIRIGREAENDVSQIDFDVSTWISLYGNGGVSLAVQRCSDANAYIVPLTIVDGVASWVISDTDTACEGRGKLQLTYVVDEKVKKSQVYKFVVAQSLVGSDDVPDPYENWLETLTQMTAETSANAQSAQASAESAETSAESASESASDAKDSEEASAESAQNASEHEAGATAQALKAEGYAVGTQDGTAVSEGEYFENNAKFYAELAQQGAEESGFAWFSVNNEDGEAYVTVTDSLAATTSFAVNTSTGELEVAVNG